MLKILGRSDDIVEANIRRGSKACEACGQSIPPENSSEGVVESELREEEFSCYGESVIFTIGEDDAGVVVEMYYAGVWGAKIHQLDEDIPIPWLITVGAEGYSVIVSIDCPQNTRVRWMTRKVAS